jgi:molecular chaperone HscB
VAERKDRRRGARDQEHRHRRRAQPAAGEDPLLRSRGGRDPRGDCGLPEEAGGEAGLSPDYFSFLGLPRKLRIDVSDLERRYRTLSREFHPDYFYNAPAAERRASLERSAYLNDAYRTLKEPVSRLEYLLRIEGREQVPVGDRRQPVPADLLEEVFALNEELDEVRSMREAGAPADAWRARLDRARGPIDAKKREHDAQIDELSARWDAAVDAQAPGDERREILVALRERVLERKYIENLLAGIARELNG